MGSPALDLRAVVSQRLAALENRRGQLLGARERAHLVDAMVRPGSSWRRQLDGLAGQPGAGLPPSIDRLYTRTELGGGIPADPPVYVYPTSSSGIPADPAQQLHDAARAFVQNLTSSVSAPNAEKRRRKAQTGRRQRVALRDALQTFTRNNRVAGCGQRAVSEDIGIVQGETGAAHYDGVQFCGRIWLCPVCAAKVASERTRELRAVLDRHRERGGGVFFATFTVPHQYGDDLETARKLVAELFRRVKQGRAWKRDERDYAITGIVRAVECTHGANGWHPHIHALFLSDRELTEDDRAAFHGSIARRWVAMCAELAGRAPLMRHQVIKRAIGAQDLAEYVAKMGHAKEIGDDVRGERDIALELTRWDRKSGYTNGARPGRTPFQILRDYTIATRRVRQLRRALASPIAPASVVELGAQLQDCRRRARRDKALWREWERAMRGAKQLTWSRGLRDRYGLTERDDVDIANAPVGGARLVVLSRAMWAIVCATPGLKSMLLDEVEDGGAEAAETLLLDVLAHRRRRGIAIEPDATVDVRSPLVLRRLRGC